MQKTNAIRDPIHQWIKISPEERIIIDSSLFQRLRYVSQLTATSHVFPGGVHKRFTHCIGVMFIAGKYASHLFKNAINKDYWVKLSRIAGLLHDIGHGPFSHAYDNTVYKQIYGHRTKINGIKLNDKNHGHDIQRIILVNTSPLKELIINAGVSIDDIVRIWTASDNSIPVYRIINAFIQGPLGADRIDFLLRDSYFTGTKHFGALAHKRIISNSCIAKVNTTEQKLFEELLPNWNPVNETSVALHYHIKIIDDIFRMLLGRFYMYKEVYYHKTSMGADMLVQKMIARAIKPLNLVERTLDLEKFVFLNDGITSEIMALDPNNPPHGCSEDEILSAHKYCRKYLLRDLPTVILSVVTPVYEFGDNSVEQYLSSNYPDVDLTDKFIMSKKPIEMLHYKPFEKNNIRIFDPKNKKSLTFKSAIIKTHYFADIIAGSTDNQYIVIRVYSID